MSAESPKNQSTETTDGDEIWRGEYTREKLEEKKKAVRDAIALGDSDAIIAAYSGLSSYYYSHAGHLGGIAGSKMNDAKKVIKNVIGKPEEGHDQEQKEKDEEKSLLLAVGFVAQTFWNVTHAAEKLALAFAASQHMVQEAGGKYYDRLTADQLDVRQSVMRKIFQYTEALKCIEAALQKEGISEITRQLLLVGRGEIMMKRKDIEEAQNSFQTVEAFANDMYVRWQQFQQNGETVSESSDPSLQTVRQTTRLFRALGYFYTKKEDTNRAAKMFAKEKVLSDAGKTDPYKRGSA